MDNDHRRAGAQNPKEGCSSPDRLRPDSAHKTRGRQVARGARANSGAGFQRNHLLNLDGSLRPTGQAFQRFIALELE
jgi:hypothetical protein